MLKFQRERISKTFAFGTKGHSAYMCNPSELQKIYLSNNTGSSNLTDMLPELFNPKVVSPPPPKTNIFKSIFSVTPLDREELCEILFNTVNTRWSVFKFKTINFYCFLSWRKQWQTID